LDPEPTLTTNFGHLWLLTPRNFSPYRLCMAKSEYLTEYDEIVNTMQMYIDGSKQGKSGLMRPAFHPDASFFGYAGEQLAIGTQFLFDWIDKNGPAPKIEPRMVSVDILESIAVVRLEVAGWSGNVVGSDVYMSDLFTLLKTPSGWKIIQKAFHWHA
jgi:Putative lumazine-binding